MAGNYHVIQSRTHRIYHAYAAYIYAHLVVDDDVDRSADGEVVDTRHLHRLVHHTLPGEGCVAVDEDRHGPLLRLLREPTIDTKNIHKPRH